MFRYSQLCFVVDLSSFENRSLVLFGTNNDFSLKYAELELETLLKASENSTGSIGVGIIRIVNNIGTILLIYIYHEAF
jgi:hypothetical protein